MRISKYEGLHYPKAQKHLSLKEKLNCSFQRSADVSFPFSCPWYMASDFKKNHFPELLIVGVHMQVIFCNMIEEDVFKGLSSLG